MVTVNLTQYITFSLALELKNTEIFCSIEDMKSWYTL